MCSLDPALIRDAIAQPRLAMAVRFKTSGAFAWHYDAHLKATGDRFASVWQQTRLDGGTSRDQWRAEAIDGTWATGATRCEAVRALLTLMLEREEATV